jgi:hypothetical protein
VAIFGQRDTGRPQTVVGHGAFRFLNGRGAMNPSVLLISPSMYREYVEEYKKLARAASDEPQRALYFKMASMWEHAALRFENGYETSGLTSERDELKGNRET